MTAALPCMSTAAVRFRARLTTPASAQSVFEVEGRLDACHLDIVALNATAYPAGSRLDVVLCGQVDDAHVEGTRRRLAWLAERGIGMTLSPARPGAVSGDDGEPGRPTPEPDRRLVLVADDDPEMRRLVSTLLRMSGHRVIEAADGTQVLNRIESAMEHAPIDVIVSDVDMPGLSGLDLLAALRCARWSTPVVLLTALGDPDVRAEARELGAAAILAKPFQPDALRTAVEMARAS